jgi:hypothetical protein
MNCQQIFWYESKQMQKFYALHSLYSFQAIYQERKRLEKMMEDEILAFGRMFWSLAEELGMTTEEMKTWQDSLGFANSSSPDDSFYDDEEYDGRFLQAGFYKATASDDDSSSSILSMPSDWVGVGVSSSLDGESDDVSAF